MQAKKNSLAFPTVALAKNGTSSAFLLHWCNKPSKTSAECEKNRLKCLSGNSGGTSNSMSGHALNVCADFYELPFPSLSTSSKSSG